MERTYTLVISCPDKVGIVSEVSQFIAQQGGWILEANHHSDAKENWFFMRHEIRANSLKVDLNTFKATFAKIADRFAMKWFISDSEKAKKVVLMVSKASHCLVDLLHRWHSKELHCDIVRVISNHQDLSALVKWYGIPYQHIPVASENKEQAFATIAQSFAEAQVEVIVLARYMQIIPHALCASYAGRMINIHHSFLPSFIGAMPYHQAYERGVKLIGATSHYVTQDLDQGPIIEQDVIRVNHQLDADDLARLGRDVEKNVLARALRWHLEDRILVHDNKTVVFN